MRSKLERIVWKSILSLVLGVKCPVLSILFITRLKSPAMIKCLFLKSKLCKYEERVLIALIRVRLGGGFTGRKVTVYEGIIII